MRKVIKTKDFNSLYNHNLSKCLRGVSGLQEDHFAVTFRRLVGGTGNSSNHAPSERPAKA